ncbi:unnamed protein product [Sphagnum jensenii]|uniref:Transposase n=1 Tax=Sphagnum jensenii TaxID=128206 RepID=A0ABP1A7P2_9BRYO
MMRILTLRTRSRSKTCCASTSPLCTRQPGFHFAKARIIAQHRGIYKNPLLSGISDYTVGQLVRVQVGINLQLMASILDRKHVWAFSIACDGSTHHGTSFFDVRLRVGIVGKLYNLHLVIFPFFERHFANNITKTMVKLLTSLYDRWRNKLLGITTDGEPTMTERISSVVTQLVQQATHPTYKIWCPLHQLDLDMKSGMNNIQDGQFYKYAHAFSVYLRAQQILIVEMDTTCPRDTNRWTHVTAMLSWMLKHRVRLFQHIEKKHPHQAPSTMWWIIASGIVPVGEEIKKMFVKLQGNLLILSQQREMIANTITSIISMWNIHKIVAEPPDGYDAQLYYINVDWWVEFDMVTDCIAEHGGSFSRDRFEELDVNEQQLDSPRNRWLCRRSSGQHVVDNYRV